MSHPRRLHVTDEHVTLLNTDCNDIIMCIYGLPILYMTVYIIHVDVIHVDITHVDITHVYITHVDIIHIRGLRETEICVRVPAGG